MEMTMSNRYVVAGLWFFGIAIGLSIAIVVLGPVSGIRVLGLIGLLSAMTGFVLHLNELRDTDRRAYAALGRHLERIARMIEHPMRHVARGRVG
jgi:multisubunit Na+/H+ antiporter MnhF subunit